MLLDSTTTAAGAVILRYEPVKARPPPAEAMPQPSGIDYSFGGPPRRSSAVLRMVSAISGLLLDNIWKSTA